MRRLSLALVSCVLALPGFATPDNPWIVEQQPGGTVAIHDDTLVHRVEFHVV